MSGTESLTADDPRQLGGYTLTARLGQGGQGVVYLGQDDSDGSAVAVKTLHSDGIDAAGMRRQLAEEVETARRVARFCTAQVLAADIDAVPPYVVSEYIEGPSLQKVVRQDGPMRGASLERLAVGTLTALAAIHQAGIVHRDFKPGNVLMGPGGPRVIDFGIARALEGTAVLTSQIAGTPAYMAPEQIAGEALGPAVDLFSWGSTMVFAANGWGPFGQNSLHQVLHNVSNEEADLGALEGRLRDIAARCLSKDPAQRPSAAETLMAVLGVAMVESPADEGPDPEPAEEPGSLPIHTLAAGAVAAAAPEARESTAAELRNSLPEEEIEAAAAEEGLFRSYPPTSPPASAPGYGPGPPQAPAAPSGPQTPPGAGGSGAPWAPPGSGPPSGPQPPQPGPTAPPATPMPPTGGQQPAAAPPPAPPSGPQPPYGPGPGRPAPSPQPPNAPGPAAPPSGPQPPYDPGQQPSYGPGPGPGAPSAPGGPPPAASPYGPTAGTGPAPTGGQPGYGPGPVAPSSGPQPTYGPAPGAPTPSGPQPAYGPGPGLPGAQPPSPYGPGAPPQPGAPVGAPAKSSGSGGAGVIIGVVVGASILVVIVVVIIIAVIIG